MKRAMNQRWLLLLSIAYRNLARNRRRSLIAGFGIALGVGLSISSFGVMDGMSSDMVHSVTDVELGHIQVHEPGFSLHPKLSLAFDQAAARARAVQGTRGVAAVSPRVRDWALLSGPRQSAGVQLLGIDPEREAKLSQLDRRITSGQYLGPRATPWPAAKALNAEQERLDQALTRDSVASAAAEIDALGADEPPPASADTANVASETQQLLALVAPQPKKPPPLLLGSKLAKKLHAKPGTLVSVMAQDLKGAPVNVDFRVVGIFHTGDASLDSVRAVGHIADIQHLYGLAGHAHELAIRVAHTSQTPSITRALAENPALAGLEVKSWQELRPDVVAMIQSNSVLTAMLIGIIVAVAAIGVADTILMAVFERRRELGMLKAVGMRPRQLVLMVVAETVLLGVGASLAGLGLGLGLDVCLLRFGIPLTSLSSFSLAGASIPPVLHASITSEGLLVPPLTMLVMALLAALWPALLAARTEPVIAMHDR